MKKLLLLLLLNWCFILLSQAQAPTLNNKQRKAVYSLIENYAKARENSDTILLKHILTEDVDQLVSTGEWRNGINEAVQGMLKSSSTNPGTRTLKIEKIRMLNSNCGLVDCRYEIQNPDSTIRKMWSTFIVVTDRRNWKIAGIRNMLPTGH
jgi:hypothetical protein